MNTYIVEGADRATGAERSCVVDAEDEKAAGKRAVDEHSMFVAKITLVRRSKPETPPPEAHVGTLEYSNGRPNERISELPPPRPTPPKRQRQVPDYHSTLIISIMLRLAGAAAMILGAVIFIGYARAVAERPSGSVTPIDLLVVLPSAGGAIVSGLILFGFGELLGCIRDMSRNSFHAAPLTSLAD